MELLPGEHPMKYSENDYNERHAECPAGMSISQKADTLSATISVSFPDKRFNSAHQAVRRIFTAVVFDPDIHRSGFVDRAQAIITQSNEPLITDPVDETLHPKQV